METRGERALVNPELQGLEQYINDGVINVPQFLNDQSALVTWDEVQKHYAKRRSYDHSPYYIYTRTVNEAEELRRQDQPDVDRLTRLEKTADSYRKSCQLEIAVNRNYGNLRNILSNAQTVDTILLLYKTTMHGSYVENWDYPAYGLLPSYNDLIDKFFNFESQDPSELERLGEGMACILRECKSINPNVVYGRTSYFGDRYRFTYRATEHLGLERHSKQEFKELIDSGEIEERKKLPGGRQAAVFLLELGFHKIKKVPEATKVYSEIRSPRQLFENAELLDYVYDAFLDPNLRDQVLSMRPSGRLMADGVGIFLEIVKDSAEKGKAQNAKAINAELQRRKIGYGTIPFAAIIDLANTVSRQINKTLPEGEEQLERLDDRSIADLPAAFRRLFHTIYNLGDKPDTLEELEEKHNQLLFIAETVAASATIKKLQQGARLADLRLLAPNATPEEIQALQAEVNAGSQISDVHERYRLLQQSTGGRAYWRKHRPGYGLIS